VSIFSFAGKLMAIWARDGDKFERMAEIWLEDSKPPASPAEAANELRKAVGAKPMTPGEQAAFDREHQIHRRE
jgi:hypothetical protein